MKIGLKGILVIGLGLALLKPAFGAEGKKPIAKEVKPPSKDEKPASKEGKSEFKDQKQKESYSIGMNIGNSIKNGGVDLDLEVMLSAMKDVLEGREPKLTPQEAGDAMNAYRQEARAKQEENRKKMSEKNRKEGEEFLAENKKKPGVKTKMVTLPDNTTAELQYKVITEGTGKMPGSNDIVSVNYKGTLINGKEFDSSAKHGGQPAKFGVKGVIRGWTEALQMMKVGSKWEVYLPASLAYADRGSPPNIEAGATLIFEMELVSTETPPPPQPAQPLTSDIIRVPSAEELKAGSNIQVLKPEDVERLTKEATNKAAKKP